MRGLRKTALLILCFMLVVCMSIPNYTVLAASPEVIWLNKEYKLGYQYGADDREVSHSYDGLGRVMFSEGLAVVSIEESSGRKYGFIDEKGNEVIPLKYDLAYPFKDGLAIVKLDGKWGYIDKSGNEIIPPKYDRAYSFSEGLAAVELNLKCGFIDKTGTVVIPIKYLSVRSFKEGLAAAYFYIGRNEGYSHGYIDRKGNIVISPKYMSDYSFKDGVTLVETYPDEGSKIGIIKSPIAPKDKN